MNYNPKELLYYTLGDNVEAFSTMREAELPYSVLQPHQVHEDTIRVVKKYGLIRDDLQGVDALVTNLKNQPIAVRTADCVPILIYDPTHQAVAAIHSGWRGTVKHISQKTISVMKAQFQTVAEDLYAVIGPCIGPDSFQVGQEVVDEFSHSNFPMAEILLNRGKRIEGTMQGGLHIDLWRANAWLLEQMGVKSTNINIVGIDTYKHNDLFFSARHEGRHCGRIINAITIH